MVELKRKKGESFEAFIRRFNKRLLQSGKLFEARKGMFRARPKSKTKARGDALRRIRISGQKEFLRKTGRLTSPAKGKKKFKR